MVSVPESPPQFKLIPAGKKSMITDEVAKMKKDPAKRTLPGPEKGGVLVYQAAAPLKERSST
jgi:hypothetical protein